MSQPLNFLGVTITAIDRASQQSGRITTSGQTIAVTHPGAVPVKWDVLINSDQTYKIKVSGSEDWVSLVDVNLTLNSEPTSWELEPEKPSSGSPSQKLYAIYAHQTRRSWTLPSIAPGQVVTVPHVICVDGTVGLWLFA